MNKPNQLTRRRFIALSVLGAGGMCLLSRCAKSASVALATDHRKGIETA